MELGPCATTTAVDWVEAINKAEGRSLVVYTDGSMDEAGQVGGGWFAGNAGGGSVGVGTVATVWDGKVAGIQQALLMASDVDLLVLTDSKAAVASIVQAGQLGKGRTRDLVEVVNGVGRHLALGLMVRFRWVKAHVEIQGNERVDTLAKVGCRPFLLP